jgi:hypothetical protein
MGKIFHSYLNSHLQLVSFAGHTIENRLKSICERFQGQRYERRVSRKVSNFTSLNAWVFVVAGLCVNVETKTKCASDFWVDF